MDSVLPEHPPIVATYNFIHGGTVLRYFTQQDSLVNKGIPTNMTLSPDGIMFNRFPTMDKNTKLLIAIDKKDPNGYNHTGVNTVIIRFYHNGNPDAIKQLREDLPREYKNISYPQYRGSNANNRHKQAAAKTKEKKIEPVNIQYVVEVKHNNGRRYATGLIDTQSTSSTNSAARDTKPTSKRMSTQTTQPTNSTKKVLVTLSSLSTTA